MPSTGDILAGCLLTVVFLAIIAVAELWRRFGNPDPEWTRKLIHLAGGAVAVSMPFLIHSHWVILAMALGMAGLFALGKLTGRLRSLHSVSRKSRGTEYYPLMIYVLFCLAHNRPWKYVICVLVLAVADALAALIGTRFGRIRYELDGNQKSLEGSLAFFLATFAAVAVPLWLWPDPTIPPLVNCLLAAALVGALATGFEAVAQDGRDNLWVPLGTYIVLTKILRQPLSEIVSQNLKLAALSIAVALVAWWTGALNVGGTLVFILTAYGCWSLTSFDWVLPFLLAFCFYLVVREACHVRPQIRSRGVVGWLLIPFLVIALANFAWLRGDLARYQFWFGPFLASCTTVAMLASWAQVLRNCSPETWMRIGGIAALAVLTWATVAVAPWLVQDHVPPAALWVTLLATLIAAIPAALSSKFSDVAGSTGERPLLRWGAIAFAVVLVAGGQAVGICPLWNPELGTGSAVSAARG